MLRNACGIFKSICEDGIIYFSHALRTKIIFVKMWQLNMFLQVTRLVGIKFSNIGVNDG